MTPLYVACSFGTSATTQLLSLLQMNDTTDLIETLQAPALAIVVANVGSSIVAYIQATPKNRNRIVWFLKGLFGGPLAIAQLRGLNVLNDASRTRSGGREDHETTARTTIAII